jgi:hypothetical protein
MNPELTPTIYHYLYSLLYNLYSTKAPAPLFKALPYNTPNHLFPWHHTPHGHASEKVFLAKIQNSPVLIGILPSVLVLESLYLRIA